MEFAKAPSE
jgi:hypothetical protein